MDKQVVLAVAGSGKTKHIIDRLEVGSRTLIVTYTINNTVNLKKRILKKFGHIPEGIRVYTYFSFLMSFCVRPIVGNDIKIKGISYSDPPKYEERRKLSHYINNDNRLYHSRIAKFMIDFTMIQDTSERIDKYFDLFCVDEVQDFAANDFNLICALSNTNVEILLIGDFYQHTFDTSRDGNTQKNLHKKLEGYCDKLNKAGYSLDPDILSHSHRCSPSICEFVSENLGIKIESHRTDRVKVSYVEKDVQVKELMENDSIVKLFYKNSHTYKGWTDNWGNTKGLDDFIDICIVLNPTTLTAYKKGKLDTLAPSTANKLYVACTRAKGNLYFIPQRRLSDFLR